MGLAPVSDKVAGTAPRGGRVEMLLLKPHAKDSVGAHDGDGAGIPPQTGRATSWVRWVELGSAVALLVLGVWVAVVAANREDMVRLVGAAVLLAVGLGLAATFAVRHIRRRWLAAVTVLVTLAASVATLVPSTMAVLRCEYPSAGGDLTQCDLARKNLAGWDLSGADLTGAALRNSDLGGADLTGARLVSADLSMADLSSADLSDAVLNDADLSAADLSGATLAGADLSRVDLTSATLTGATGAGVDLTGADLTGATATEARFEQAVAAELTATGIALDGAQLPDADLSGAQLDQSTIARADFTGATLTSTSWAGASGEDAVFVAADLSGALLDGAALAGASFANADLGWIQANAADLQAADLTSADLSRATLRRADLAGANLRDASLAGATLADADVHNASLAGANLSSVDLTNSKGLTHAQLRAALGVPQDELAAAVVRNDLRLESPKAITRVVSRVPGGNGVEDAASYRASSAFHPLVVHGGQGSTGLRQRVNNASGTWAPPALSFTELVATANTTTQTVQVCPYSLSGMPSTTLTRIRRVLHAKVFSATTGELVAEQTVQGSEPRACQRTEMFSLDEATNGKKVYGGQPDYATVISWLRNMVHPVAGAGGGV